MLFKGILEWGLYVGLLVPALVFVYNYVKEYLEGKTFFVETIKPLTLNDLPVATICFGYLEDTYFNEFTEEQRIRIMNGEYLRRVEVNILVDSDLLKIDPAEQVLTMENNTIIVPGGEWILKQSRVTDEGLANLNYNGRDCFKIMAKLNDSVKMLETITNFVIGITYPEEHIPPRGQLALSTEENSYGFDQRKWFDGVVEVVNWDTGELVELMIADITEYHYLGPTCSSVSFYECLANRFSSLSVKDLEKYLKGYCQVENLTRVCLPFSLPSTIPTCKNSDPGFLLLVHYIIIQTLRIA